MIICSCAVISTEDVTRAVEWMQASDPNARITPSKLYRALGKEPDCGGCIALMLESIAKSLGQHDDASERDVPVLPTLRVAKATAL